MRPAVIAVLCVATVLPSCGGREPGETGGGVKGAIRWSTSIPDALKAAGEQGKPVMADFFSERCSWCGKLDRETYADAAVRELAKKFVAVKVDVGKDPAAGRAYGIHALPTVLFMNAGGKVVHRVVGFKPPGAFLQEMRKALDPARQQS